MNRINFETEELEEEINDFFLNGLTMLKKDLVFYEIMNLETYGDAEGAIMDIIFMPYRSNLELLIVPSKIMKELYSSLGDDCRVQNIYNINCIELRGLFQDVLVVWNGIN